MNAPFELGSVVATPEVIALFGEDYSQKFEALLQRHVHGDWGDMCDEDKQQNDEALVNGGRIFSAYNQPEGKVWLITEADRSVTTFLLPEEY